MLRKPAKMTPLEKEVKQVERYEYLLVEYLKEISNEITYLVLVVCSLFLYIMLDYLSSVSPVSSSSYDMIRVIFILLIIGGFGLFGMSNITKRRIERKFEQMFY